MAYAFPAKMMYGRFESRLNPCRWCGGKAEFQREQFDYGFQESVRVTCLRNDEPIYTDPIYRDMTTDTAEYFGRIFSALFGLVNNWNARNDGPGFIAGLA